MADVLLLQRPRLPFTSAPVATVTVDQTRASAVNGLTWTHTVGTGANSYLLVRLNLASGTSLGQTVTWGGQPMTLLSRAIDAQPNTVELWGLVNPLAGTQTITVVLTGATPGMANDSSSFFNVDQSGLPMSAVSAIGTGTTATSGAITGKVGDMLVDALVSGSGTIAGANHVLLQSDGGGDAHGFLMADGTSQTTTWTGVSAGAWAVVIACLRAVPAQNTDVILTGPENHESDVWLGQSFFPDNPPFAPDAALLLPSTSLLPQVPGATSTVDIGLGISPTGFAPPALPSVHTNVTPSDNGLGTFSDVVGPLFFTRSITDNGLASFSDTIAVVRFLSFAETDTALSLSEVLVHTVTRPVSDNGLASFSDSAQRQIVLRAVADTGISSFSDTVAEIKFLTKAETDTALVSFSETLVHTITHFETDTAISSFSETLIHTITRPVADTGISSFSDTPLRQPVGRSKTDTALSSFSDTLTHIVGRPDTDTALSSFSDTLIHTITHSETDTAISSFSDSPLRQLVLRAETDTALSLSESVIYFISRPDSDTALNFSDSVVRTVSLTFAETDTALSLSETLVHTVGRIPSDTALSLSESLIRALQDTLTDTAITLVDSSGHTVGHPCTDTGLSFSDSVVATFAAGGGGPIDTALSFSDTVVENVSLHFEVTDTGLSASDATQPDFGRSVPDTGITFSDVVASNVTLTKLISDIVLSVSESIQQDTGRPCSETFSFTDLVSFGISKYRVDLGTALDHIVGSSENIFVFDGSGGGGGPGTGGTPKEIYLLSDGRMHVWISGKGSQAIYL